MPRTGHPDSDRRLSRHRRSGHQRRRWLPIRAFAGLGRVVGVVGICIFAQMSGRVAAVSGRATFELIRERLGPRLAVLNLSA